MHSGSHVQLAALRNRDLELQTTSPFSNHGSVGRSTACFRHKNVLVLLGFQKFPFFCVILYVVHLLVWKINCTKCTVCTSKYSPLCFSPRTHGGDNDVGNLIVSECLPETSRPALDFSDDYNKINYVNKSNESGSSPSHASGVRSVEMKSVWCNIVGYKVLWNDNWFFSIVTVWRFCPLEWLFGNKQRVIMLGSIEPINSINKHISVMKELLILPVQLKQENSPTALDNMKYVEYRVFQKEWPNFK